MVAVAVEQCHISARTEAWLFAMVALVHLPQEPMLQTQTSPIYFWHLALSPSLAAVDNSVDNRVPSNLRFLFVGIPEAQVEVAAVAVLELAAPASLSLEMS